MRRANQRFLIVSRVCYHCAMSSKEKYMVLYKFKRSYLQYYTEVPIGIDLQDISYVANLFLSWGNALLRNADSLRFK